ncbi:MAG: methyltransferase domain-containing protein [Undibacterium sp.]|nr:methyltransferase domain-containing protein [Undibacterium sp.]
MQNFQSKDPMQPGFWNERFETRFTPWDKGGVPQALQDFVARAEHPLVTLIPGCGIGYEAAFLAQSGWDVTAIDFSPAAVASAKAAIGEWGKHVVEADFFQYHPARPLGLIYERAFLCALPPAMRLQIVQRWAALLAAGGVLAGFFYLDDTAGRSLKGPPFSISSAELQALMTPYFELLEDHGVDDSIPVFVGKERWQVWRRLPAA